MSIYASDPDAQPDDDFEPGTLCHLAAGARGRLLDPRRTPVSVVGVRAEVGFVDVRIEGFEDAGAVWEVPLEQVDHYQFAPGGPRASDHAVAEMEHAIRRFAREQAVEVDGSDGELTEASIAQRQAEIAGWLGSSSRFLAGAQELPDPSTRLGDPLLASDLEACLRGYQVWDVEEAFAQSYVSNPGSGEMVKGHRIVLAELGLAPYQGPVVRDPATFGRVWSKRRRTAHIITRLAFLRALFGHLGTRSVSLWRGLSTAAELREPARGRTFVSTSFDETVARAHFESGGTGATRVLVGQVVPVEHLFMTYLETAAMNDRFREAEAVLLARPDDRWP